MIRIIKELSKKHVTIFLSSHLLPVVEKLCNKVGIIRDGRIIVVDAVDNLTNRLRSVEIHGLVIEISFLTGDVMSKLRSLDGVLNVHVEEGKMFVEVDRGMDPKLVGAEVNKTLVQGGVFVYSIRSLEPNLEDVFLDLVSDD